MSLILCNPKVCLGLHNDTETKLWKKHQVFNGITWFDERELRRIKRFSGRLEHIAY